MSDEPEYETRWGVEGTPHSFSSEGIARAFAKPHQRVFWYRRRLPIDPDHTLEFIFAPVKADEG